MKIKIVFDSEFEKTSLMTTYCPGDIGLKELRFEDKRCCAPPNFPNMKVCTECWEKAVEMEVKEA